MNKSWKYLFFLIAGLMGCSQKVKDLKSDIIRVEVDDQGAEIRMSSLVDTVSIIQLGNQELIGSIDDLVWAENRETVQLSVSAKFTEDEEKTDN